MPVLTKRVTPAQKAWLVNYEAETGFEPIYQEKLNGKLRDFQIVAQMNLKWFDEWASDTRNSLEFNLGQIK